MLFPYHCKIRDFSIGLALEAAEIDCPAEGIETPPLFSRRTVSLMNSYGRGNRGAIL